MTEPLRPNRSCIAAAPTKGGITSGSTPSVWISERAAELEAHGEVGERQRDDGAKTHRHAARRTRLLQNDSRISESSKNAAKCASVKLPSAVR